MVGLLAALQLRRPDCDSEANVDDVLTHQQELRRARLRREADDNGGRADVKAFRRASPIPPLDSCVERRQRLNQQFSSDRTPQRTLKQRLQHVRRETGSVAEIAHRVRSG